MIYVFFEQNGILSAREKLELMMLPPKKRARLLWRVAAQVRAGSKRNITRQQTPEGHQWEKRKKKRHDGKQKMLLGMAPLIVVSDRQSDANKAIVTFKRWQGAMKSPAAKKTDPRIIAHVHQTGSDRLSHGKTSPVRSVEPRAQCTRRQAKFLKSLDFSVWARRVDPRAQQGRRVKPPIKWIMANVTDRECRRWVAKAREQGVIRRQGHWRIPARKFLGISREKYRKAWDRAIQSIQYGWQVKAQNRK